MKTILLTRGRFAIVDDDNYEDLIQFRWCVHRSGNNYYAERNIRVNKKHKIESMHRRILGLKFGDGKFTDHVNGDGLDNRRSNLRVCTKKENCRNRVRPRNNTSGYKGVSWDRGRWKAEIGLNSQRKYLGGFASPIEAALAYNTAALKYYGKFAKLNQISARKEI